MLGFAIMRPVKIVSQLVNNVPVPSGRYKMEGAAAGFLRAPFEGLKPESGAVSLRDGEDV